MSEHPQPEPQTPAERKEPAPSNTAVYAATGGAVIIAVSSMVTIVALVALKADPATVAAIVGTVILFDTSIIGATVAAIYKQQQDQHKQSNARMDQALSLTARASRAEGVAAGRSEVADGKADAGH